MDGAYAHLAAGYKRTTDHCIAELNGCLTPGAWLKSSCLAGCFFQESPTNIGAFAAHEGRMAQALAEFLGNHYL